MQINRNLILTALLLIIICLQPAAALLEDFQGNIPITSTDYTIMYEAGVTSITYTLNGNDPWKWSEQRIMNISWSGAGASGVYLRNTNSMPATNWSFVLTTLPTGTSTNIVPKVKFYSATDLVTPLLTWEDPSTGFYPYGIEYRYDFRWEPTAGRINAFLNNKYFATVGVTATVPAYFAAGARLNGASAYLYIDDYAINPAIANFNTVESIPSDSYIIIDDTIPANNGLYNSSGLVNSVNYSVRFSTRDNLTKTINIESYSIGTHYETLKTIASCTNRTAFNISSLSAALPGRYQFWLEGGDSGLSVSSSPFWIVGFGANFTLDRSAYATDDNVYATYKLMSGYYDPTSYDYSIVTYNVYGTLIDTTVIPSTIIADSTYYNQVIATLDSADYPAGDYWAALIATPKGGGTVDVMMARGFSVYNEVIVQGYAVNYTGVYVPNLLINVTQSDSTDQQYSTPAWNQSGLLPSIAINISANMTRGSGGFLQLPVNFTPPGYGTYNINLYTTLDQRNMTTTGTNSVIYGFVKTGLLNQPVPNASVVVENATWRYETIANATGYYEVRNLYNWSGYNVRAFASRHTNSSTSTANASSLQNGFAYNATRLDLECEQEFNVQINAVKSSDPSQYVLDPVTLYAVNGATVHNDTTVVGHVNYTLTYDLWQFSATATDYTATSTSEIVDSDMVITLYLTPTEEEDAFNIKYPPAIVRFHTQNFAGAPLADVCVSAMGVETSTGNYDYIALLFGYPLDEVPINGTLMEGYTDTRGDITFAMLNTVKYNVTFTKSGYSFIPMLITAKAENYIIEGYSTSGVDIPFIQNGTSTAATFNLTVTTNRTSQHGANVTVYFNDTSFRTVSGYVVIWQSNHTLGNPLNTNRTEFYNATFTGFQTVKEWVVPLSNTSVDGESYMAEVVATSPLKTNTVNQPVWFKKTPQRIGGMSSEFSLFFALAIMMFTALMAGSSSVGAVGLCVTFEGWIFYAIGFLDLIDQQMSSGAYSVPAILTIMTFVSFMALFVAGKKKR